MKPAQIRQLVFLGFLLLVSVTLIAIYPSLRSARKRALSGPVEAPAPAVEAAPAPPPSPFPEGAVVFHGVLKDVKDLTHRRELEGDRAYRTLAEHLLRLDEGRIRSSSEGPLAYGTYLRHAPELRGRVFQVQAEAIDAIEVVRLPEPVDGREDVYRLYLFDHEEGGGYIVDILDKPPSLEKRDRVELEGIFLKVLRHQNKAGADRDSPFLIARSFREPPPLPRAAPDRTFGTYLTVLGVAILVALVVAWWLMRKVARTSYRTALPRRSPRGVGPRPPAAAPPGGGPTPPAPPPGAA